MKLAIPPVLALIVLAGWAGGELHSLTELEKENDLLKARLVARTTGFEANTSAFATASADQPTSLKKLMALFTAAQRDGSHLAMLRLERQLKSMTKEELLSVLAEIDGLKTPLGPSQELMVKLFKELCQKDPKSALDRVPNTPRGSGGSVVVTLTSAMKEWPPKDLEMAEAWFKEATAAGKFDTSALNERGYMQWRLKSGLLGAWIAADPAIAAARLSAMPVGNRAEALSSACDWGFREQDQLTVAHLARTIVPEEGREVLADIADTIAVKSAMGRVIGKYTDGDANDLTGDFSAVTDFFDRIQATPEERAACVERCILRKANGRFDRKITSDKIESIRAWTLAQAPSVLDNVTSALLWHRAGQGLTFPQVAELASQYNRKSADDSLLIKFLSQKVPEGDKADARLLAEKINDPARRQTVLDGLK